MKTTGHSTPKVPRTPGDTNEKVSIYFALTAQSEFGLTLVEPAFGRWKSWLLSMYDPPNFKQRPLPLNEHSEGEGHAAVWIGDKDNGDHTIYVAFRFISDRASVKRLPLSTVSVEHELNVNAWAWGIAESLWQGVEASGDFHEYGGLKADLINAFTHCQDCTVLLIGHSHGGVLAQIIAYWMVWEGWHNFYAVSFGSYQWLADSESASLYQGKVGNRLLALVPTMDFTTLISRSPTEPIALAALQHGALIRSDPYVGWPWGRFRHVRPLLQVTARYPYDSMSVQDLPAHLDDMLSLCNRPGAPGDADACPHLGTPPAPPSDDNFATKESAYTAYYAEFFNDFDHYFVHEKAIVDCFQATYAAILGEFDEEHP